MTNQLTPVRASICSHGAFLKRDLQVLRKVKWYLPPPCEPVPRPGRWSRHRLTGGWPSPWHCSYNLALRLVTQNAIPTQCQGCDSHWAHSLAASRLLRARPTPLKAAGHETEAKSSLLSSFKCKEPPHLRLSDTCHHTGHIRNRNLTQFAFKATTLYPGLETE